MWVYGVVFAINPLLCSCQESEGKGEGALL